MTFYVRNKNEQISSREFIVLKGTQNCHVLSSLLIRPSLSVAHFLIPVFLPVLPSRPFFANNFIPRRHATPRVIEFLLMSMLYSAAAAAVTAPIEARVLRRAARGGTATHIRARELIKMIAA